MLYLYLSNMFIDEFMENIKAVHMGLILIDRVLTLLVTPTLIL